MKMTIVINVVPLMQKIANDLPILFVIINFYVQLCLSFSQKKHKSCNSDLNIISHVPHSK